MSECQPIVIVQPTINQIVQQALAPKVIIDQTINQVQQITELTQVAELVDNAYIEQVTEGFDILEINVPGLPGPPGPPGTGTGGGGTGAIPLIDFSYGDAAHAVFAAPEPGKITYARVSIDTAFDGTNPQIKVGTGSNPESIIPIAYNNPAQLGDYENTPDVPLATNESVVIAILPGFGATQGAGFLLIEFTPD